MTLSSFQKKLLFAIFILGLLLIFQQCGGCEKAVSKGKKYIPQIPSLTKTQTNDDGKPMPVRKAADLPKPQPVTAGEIKAVFAKIKPVEDNTPLLSAGIPFPPGWLTDDRNIVFVNDEGKEIPIATKILARWPQDQSIRSVLVQFPYSIPRQYQYGTMKWGQARKTADFKVVEPRWDFPEGYIVLPAQWLCDAQVIGEQVPLGQRVMPKYDENIEKNFQRIRDIPLTGDLRTDGYYSTPHTFYQFYVRSGGLEYFLAARRELLHYRENQIKHSGPDKGMSTAGAKPRYLYLEAMADDYFLTGDPRTLEVAAEMIGFLERHYKPEQAFYSKSRTNFWTERRVAAPFLAYLTYFEMTGEKKYLRLADEYMKNLYETQMQWPSRGGFIHNLYAHDPEEGARPDEYGGSPFMTGLLLEPIIKYHQLTGSDIAADSIFRALDWIIKEGLSTAGDGVKYLTADKYASDPGQPDLNLLLVHAFGYGYRLSGYQNKEYLNTGMNLLRKGVDKGYLGKRKHFNQNYRSSGHFFAYINNGTRDPSLGKPGLETRRSSLENLQATRNESRETSNEIRAIRPLGEISPEWRTSVEPRATALYYEQFEMSAGKFSSPGDAELKIDSQNVYRNGNALYAKSKFLNSNLSFGFEMEYWDIDRFPRIRFAYQIPPETPVGMRVQTSFGDWICVGGTAGYKCAGTAVKNPYMLADDGKWHETDIDVRAAREILPKLKGVTAFQFFTDGNATGDDGFWMDEFFIGK